MWFFQGHTNVLGVTSPSPVSQSIALFPESNFLSTVERAESMPLSEVQNMHIMNENF